MRKLLLSLTLVLLMTSTAYAGFTFVNSAKEDTDASGTSLDCSSSLNIQTGDVLIAIAKWEDGTATPSISKNSGSPANSFTMRSTSNNGGHQYAAWGYVLSASADSSATFRLTLSTGRAYRTIIVLQFRPDSGEVVSFLDDAPATGSGTAEQSGNLSTAGTETDVVVCGYHAEYAGGFPTGEQIGDVTATGVIDAPALCSTSVWYRIIASSVNGIHAQATIPDQGWLSDIIALSSVPGIVIPTVTVQSTTSIDNDSGTGNGNITNTGGENCDKRGFVYGKTSQSDPGNVVPASSGYASYVEDSGSYGTGAYDKEITSLDDAEIYYIRAYAHNSSGYDYSDTESYFVTSRELTKKYGLDWDGTGDERRMLYWSTPLAMYPATYLFKIYQRNQVADAERYYTTFFWGNNGAFVWGTDYENSYYGANPYPVPPTAGNGKWSISIRGDDEYTRDDSSEPYIVNDVWYSQAFVAQDLGSDDFYHRFYINLPDVTTTWRITESFNDSTHPATPPTPVLMFGQAPNVGGLSWGGYSRWEEQNAIIRGIQVYNVVLTESQILQLYSLETDTAVLSKCTDLGISAPWYLNMNPIPGDVADKSGNDHDPTWDGTARPTLYQEAMTNYIDTRDKRASIINILLPFGRVLPTPGI